MALRISSRVRRIAVAITTLVVFIVLGGATYQGVATALERRQFPRPGGLVDVGGHQLHIYCIGKGSPVVVLEAGAGSMSAAWGWIQPEIAKTTRVCSYDRAGLGWSEAGVLGYRPTRVPEELYALLRQANETGPFVLVGDELGAAFARMFAARYRADVAALVLIDDPSTTTGAPHATMTGAWPWLARAGVLRATGRLSARATGLPGDSGGAMRAFLNRPDHLTRAAMEIERFTETEAAAHDLTLDAAVPVKSIEIGSRVQPALVATHKDAERVTRLTDATIQELRATSSPAR